MFRVRVSVGITSGLQVTVSVSVRVGLRALTLSLTPELSLGDATLGIPIHSTIIFLFLQRM